MTTTVLMDIEGFLQDTVRDTVEKLPWMKNHTMKMCESIQELKTFVDEAIKVGRCAVDLETTGLNTRIKIVDGKKEPTDRIVSVCLSCMSQFGLYVPVAHQTDPEYNLPWPDIRNEIERLCKCCTTIYHNAKFDIAMLRNHGIPVEDPDAIEDTEILSRLYDAGTKLIGLKHTAEKILGRKMIELEDISGKSMRIDLISPKYASVYGASDAICTLDLFIFFMDQEIIKSQKAIYRLEKKTLFVVLEMEYNLVKIDVPYLQEARKKAVKKLEEIKQDVYRLAGKEFNIASPPQLGKILFEDLGYQYPEKAKTASGLYSTDTATLEKISDRYPVVKSIMEFRALEKCIGTYVDNLLKNHDENDCIKIGFKQTGTDTGRFSSPGGKGIDEDGYCGVNVQSLPGVGDDTPEYMPDMRRSFIARPGYKLVAMDYKNEEMRVAACLSKEPKWIDALLHGDGDLHAATGRAVLGREPSKAERGVFKTVNFQSLYGSGPRGIAQNAKITEAEARRTLIEFFANLPTLKKWMDFEKGRARKNKSVMTEFGRIRPLIYTGDRETDSHSDRQAVNTRIQSTCADIMKTAMVRIYSYIHRNNLQDEIRLLITMHDELVFEIKEDKLSTHIPMLDNIMRLEDILQDMLKWPVPLPVDAEYGDSWHVDHDFFEENPDARVKEPYVFHTSDSLPASRFEIAKSAHSITPSPLIQENIAGSSVDPEIENLIIPISEPVKAAAEPVSSPVSESIPTVVKGSENSSSEKVDIGESTPAVDSTISQEKAGISEGIQSLGADSDLSEKKLLTSPDTLIYTLHNRNERTLTLLNAVLNFLGKEGSREDVYRGPKQALVLRDSEGFSHLVSGVMVYRDAFLSLARFFGL